MDFFDGKVILVTGGTGSIGSEIVKQLLKTNASRVIVYSRDEYKQFKLNGEISDKRLACVIGDVRDLERLNSVMYGVNYVFHAGALKQVPLCEYNPIEAVKTNTIGTSNVIEAAVRNNIEKLVLLSTDKVANPISTMGATKLLAERVIESYSYLHPNLKTIMYTTRFGNVLNSVGSVYPHFEKQIARGGPITITDFSVTRFMMSISEAVSLVLKSFPLAKTGQCYILKMKSLRIKDLAQVMVKNLSSKYGKSSSEVKIVEAGLRPGEKVHEELVTGHELKYLRENGDYLVIDSNVISSYRELSSYISGAKVINTSTGLYENKYSSDNHEFIMTLDEIELMLKKNSLI